MTITEAIPIAKDYQDYRRGVGAYEEDESITADLKMPIPPRHTPAQYGEALDVLILWAEATVANQ